MSELTNEEKASLIKKLCKQHDITAYEIGENTSVSSVAAHNILTGSTENPRGKTLNTILTYIENSIVGKDIPGEKNYLNNIANQNNPVYYKKDSNEILSAIEGLRKIIIDRHDIFADALKKTYINTDRDWETGLF